MRGFSQLATSLTDLTKKGAFAWTNMEHGAVETLKRVVHSCPVLTLLDFSQPFVLECDAFGEGIRAVLMQGSTQLLSRARSCRHRRDCILYTRRRCWRSCMWWLGFDNTWWAIGLRWRLTTTVSDSSWSRNNCRRGNRSGSLRSKHMILTYSMSREGEMRLKMHYLGGLRYSHS